MWLVKNKPHFITLHENKKATGPRFTGQLKVTVPDDVTGMATSEIFDIRGDVATVEIESNKEVEGYSFSVIGDTNLVLWLEKGSKVGATYKAVFFDTNDNLPHNMSCKLVSVN